MFSLALLTVSIFLNNQKLLFVLRFCLYAAKEASVALVSLAQTLEALYLAMSHTHSRMHAHTHTQIRCTLIYPKLWPFPKPSTLI